jgi:L-ascorbate 6-phosphate lactonase
MQAIQTYALSPQQAALWWLGQAGYVIRAGERTIVIDPYLSDSVAKASPAFPRLYPPPLKPKELKADVYIITHDHLDHLDPETITPYKHKAHTWFVAPHLAARKLPGLGVPEERIIVLSAGETKQVLDLEITGVFALPTGPDVPDTTGYYIRFSNGRSVYHTSDTQYHPLVPAGAPKQPEVMLVPINGKWSNTNAEQAAAFARSVQPQFVMPNHYDMMALNAEDPEVFRWFCEQEGIGERCIIPARMQAFAWPH